MNVYFERNLENLLDCVRFLRNTRLHGQERISFNFDYGHICIAISLEQQAMLSNYPEWSMPIFFHSTFPLFLFF